MKKILFIGLFFLPLSTYGADGTVLLIDKLGPKNGAFQGLVDSSQTVVNVENFSGNLSGSDTDVQKALETIDHITAMTPNSTYYLKNTSDLQSGATFYVSSGSISGKLIVYSTSTYYDNLIVDTGKKVCLDEYCYAWIGLLPGSTGGDLELSTLGGMLSLKNNDNVVVGRLSSGASNGWEDYPSIHLDFETTGLTLSSDDPVPSPLLTVSGDVNVTSTMTIGESIEVLNTTLYPYKPAVTGWGSQYAPAFKAKIYGMPPQDNPILSYHYCYGGDCDLDTEKTALFYRDFSGGYTLPLEGIYTNPSVNVSPQITNMAMVIVGTNTFGLMDADWNRYVAFKSSNIIDNNFTLTLPASTPTVNGQFMAGNTNGDLYFSDTLSSATVSELIVSTITFGEVVIQHENGTSKAYKATADSDEARGTALVTARNAAVSGDTIFVGGGGYTITSNLAKDGVNWWFAPGAVVTETDGWGIWVNDDENSDPLTYKVSGYGEFITPSSVVSASYGGTVDIEANRIYSSGASSGLNASGSSYLRAVIYQSVISESYDAMYAANGGEIDIWTPLAQTNQNTGAGNVVEAGGSGTSKIRGYIGQMKGGHKVINVIAGGQIDLDCYSIDADQSDASAIWISGGTINLNSGIITVSGGGSYKHIENTGGTVNLSPTVVYDASKISGTVTVPFTDRVHTWSAEQTFSGVTSPSIDYAGTLELNPNAGGNVELFGDVDVGDTTDGKHLKIWRKAAEGDGYWDLYTTQYGGQTMATSNSFTMSSGGNATISATDVIAKLSDASGARQFQVQDSGSNVVAYANSDGGGNFVNLGVSTNPPTGSLLRIGAGNSTETTYSNKGVIINPDGNAQAQLKLMSTGGAGAMIGYGSSNATVLNTTFNGLYLNAFEINTGSSYSYSTEMFAAHSSGIGSKGMNGVLLAGASDVTGSPAAGGSIPDGTYYYMVTSVDYNGTETTRGRSTQSAAKVFSAGNNKITLAWTAVPGAASYKVYRTQTSGTYSTPCYLGSSSTNSYLDEAASPSAGAPPSATFGGYSNAFSATGDSWLGTGGLKIQGVSVPTISSTDTLTNKRITKRVEVITSSAIPAINTDNYDMFISSEQANDITSMTTNLSGTPTEGQNLWVVLTGTGTLNITWGTGFESSTLTLPTTSAISTSRLDLGFVWNSVTSKWRLVAMQ